MSGQNPKSKWGNFFSGAVAGLESRLDTILASEDNAAARNAQVAEKLKQANSLQRTGSPRVGEEDRNKSSTSTRTDPAAPPQSSTEANTPDSDADLSKGATEHSIEATRASEELEASDPPPQIIVNNAGSTSEEDTKPDSEPVGSKISSVAPSRTESPASDIPPQSTSEAASRPPLDLTSEAEPPPSLSVDEMRSKIAHLEAEYEKKELQRQEEVHENLERIDALQAKLLYLARDAADAARNAAADAPKESLEAKLAAKDEQIALLLEEGQKLSKTEVAHAGNVKKLRVKIAEDSKILAETKRKLTVAEKTSNDLNNKVYRLEMAQKDAAAKTSRISRLEREIDGLKSTRTINDATIKALRSQIEEIQEAADEEGKKQIAIALEAERKKVESLGEDLANAKIEKQLTEDKARAEVRSIHDERERERERNLATESGLRNEISILEGRLEVFRVKNEEVNSNSMGDGQAKLMRQVETLQSQYALASENWQGIESTLQARVAALEKERNDASKSESEARKKIRELSSRSRRTQEQLDEIKEQCQSLEAELEEKQDHAENVQKQASAFQRNLQEAQKAFEEERHTWEETVTARIEEERAKWRQELSHQFIGPDPSLARADSPTLSRFTPKSPQALDIPGSTTFSSKRSPLNSRQPSNEFSPLVPDRPISRRSSVYPLPPRGSDAVMSPVNGQLDSFSGRSTPWSPSIHTEMPSIPTIDADADELAETGSSPNRTINDVISASTAGAGPSVQLVERMSAAVRRLESEKAATKDEMMRLSAQRDEARKEVVSLMREVESKRAIEAKEHKLQESMQGLEKRYQTTLEMLGEKSERVEELEADVADLKKIYKDLVDSTLR